MDLDLRPTRALLENDIQDDLALNLHLWAEATDGDDRRPFEPEGEPKPVKPGDDDDYGKPKPRL